MTRLVGIVFLAFLAFQLAAEGTTKITHRFDWRRSVDGKYVGLVYGAWYGSWKWGNPDPAGSIPVESRYLVTQESRRNTALTEKPVSAELTGTFTVAANGWMSSVTGTGGPLYRNFPGRLPPDFEGTTTWTGDAEIDFDPLNDGIRTSFPILVSYHYVGVGDFLGQKVRQVETQYALRYHRLGESSGDPKLQSVVGSRKGVASYAIDTGKLIFLRETTSEDYKSSEGTTIHNEGILFTLWDDLPDLPTGTVVATMARDLPPDVSVTADPRGVKLTLDNLKFVADQAVLLPGEGDRLNKIVSLLKTVPDRSVLVVGHTADVGSQESQQTLSEQRALSIVRALQQAGFPLSKLFYEGRGGREPVAPNDDERGRAQNRRVELIVLDQ